uniref:Pentraxin family member n=1 Tax=Catagonus wagneri TaxID=51154 RepID=A0A8C3WZ71_9CETA
MDRLLLWVSVLASLPEAFAHRALVGKVFVFPRESSTDHVELITKLEKPLQNFTLCFRAYSDLSRGYSLFSYNIQGKDNELLVFKHKIGEYSLYIGKNRVTSKVREVFPSPVHICTSWESSTGIAEFWVNGEPLVKKGLSQGYSVGAYPKIILGQEQDTYGGGFDKTQSFMGEIGDLYMWDSMLSPSEIQLVHQGLSFSRATILDWQALNYVMKGYVVIKPRVWH